MLDEAIPALWSTVHGWFTPAVLFLVLNIVIGTIAVTSKVAASASAEGDGAGGGGEHRRLSRVPSMALDRLRSFNLSRLAAPAPEPPVAGVLDLAYDQPTPRLEKEEVVEGERDNEHEHMERSRSEAAAEAELPRLPARMRKSASEKSAFAHFAAEEEDTDAVELRRPATTRDAARGWARVAEPEWEEIEEAGGGEVDARADDFINKFRHQLKLQRIDSFMRYRETIRRGQAAAAVGSE